LTVARQELIHSFADQQTRLLTLERAGGHAQGIAVRVTHEALLSHWRRAREFIESTAEELIQQAQLERDAGEWRSRAQADDLLIPAGQRMQRAHALMTRLGQELEAGTREFIEASLAHEQKQKTAAQERRFTLIRRFSMAAGTAVLVMVGVSVFAGYQWMSGRHKQANMLSQLAAVEFSRGNEESALRFSVLGARMDLALPMGIGLPSYAGAQLAAVLAQGKLRQTLVKGEAVEQEEEPRFVTELEGNKTRIRDAKTGREIAVLKAKLDSGFLRLSLSPDGTRIVSCVISAYVVQIWNVATGSEIAVLKGHDDWFTSAAFSPDGAHIVTTSILPASAFIRGSFDPTVRLWDAVTGQEIAEFSPGNSAAFDSDGQHIIASDAKTHASGMPCQHIRSWC
jgi:hypothetical protein